MTVITDTTLTYNGPRPRWLRRSKEQRIKELQGTIKLHVVMGKQSMARAARALENGGDPGSAYRSVAYHEDRIDALEAQLRELGDD